MSANHHNDWWCATCRFSVYGSKSECSKCHTKKPTSGRVSETGGGRPGDWRCENCHDLVFASRSACRKCNAKKPAPVRQQTVNNNAEGRSSRPMEGARPGDWWCENCNDLIFASRGECRKCHATKPVPRTGDGDANGPLDALLNLCKRVLTGVGAAELSGNGNTAVAESTGTTEAGENDESGSLCVVCLDSPPNVVITTCGHLCMCMSCSTAISQCPMCRAHFTTEQALKVFAS
jgi:Zinc finger, C3HC4 type (RING finger)